jgi:hypothetical protein
MANSGGFSQQLRVCNHRMIVYQKKRIEPLQESKSDYWIEQLAESWV